MNRRYKMEATVSRVICAPDSDAVKLEFRRGLGTAYQIGGSVIREMPDPLTTLETARMIRLLRKDRAAASDALTPEEHGELVALTQRYDLAGSE